MQYSMKSMMDLSLEIARIWETCDVHACAQRTLTRRTMAELQKLKYRYIYTT